MARQIVHNKDGSVSTERTITIQLDNGRYINAPSMYNGEVLWKDPKNANWETGWPDEERIKKIVLDAGGGKGVAKDPETGRILQQFNGVSEAVKSAEARSKTLEKQTKSFLWLREREK